MHFAYGATRWVIVLDRVVIKFARIRPFRMVQRYFYWRKRGGTKEPLKTFHKNRFIAAVRYMLFGIIANLAEARISRDFPEFPLAKTLFSIGFVNVQVRADDVPKSFDVDDMPEPLKSLAHRYAEANDWWVRKHWGIIDNKVCMLDYGNPAFEKIFHRHHPRSV
jgi:hypothetical protein